MPPKSEAAACVSAGTLAVAACVTGPMTLSSSPITSGLIPSPLPGSPAEPLRTGLRPQDRRTPYGVRHHSRGRAHQPPRVVSGTVATLGADTAGSAPVPRPRIRIVGADKVRPTVGLTRPRNPGTARRARDADRLTDRSVPRGVSRSRPGRHAARWPAVGNPPPQNCLEDHWPTRATPVNPD